MERRQRPYRRASQAGSADISGSDRKTLRDFALFLAFAAVVFGITAVRLVIGNAGWIVATLAIAGAAYFAGWHMQARRGQAARLRTNARYGKRGAVTDDDGLTVTARHGRQTIHDPRFASLPREPVSDADAVSAYPVSMAAKIVRGQAAAGLASLGWPESQTGAAITTAIDTVAHRGPVTVKAVITEVLRTHAARNA